MISEWLFGAVLDTAKNGVIAGIAKANQDDFDRILNKTLGEFEGKYFGFSRTDFKRFTESPVFQTHLEQHLNGKELDWEYLGIILSEYVNLEAGTPAKTLLRAFYDELISKLFKPLLTTSA